MLRRAAVLAVVLAACVLATEAQTPPSLIVQRAGPNGEIDSLDQADEIRIVFSEPMVALGRIPQPVQAPFVRIEPAIRGTFRWSGTTILIFTPDPRQPLPYATPFHGPFRPPLATTDLLPSLPIRSNRGVAHISP